MSYKTLSTMSVIKKIISNILGTDEYIVDLCIIYI